MIFADYMIELLASLIAVTFVLTMHEFAHAFVAYKCGDPTPKWSRRLSVNPLRHFDPIGLVCFALVGFGWAKPVPVNPNNFKHYRLGSALTAVAGVAMNFLLALLLFPLFQVVAHYMPAIPFLTDFLWYLTAFLFVYNLYFFVFNLLPLNPLDGFRLIESFNKRRGPVFRFLRDNGRWILLAIIAESFICDIFVRLGVGVMQSFSILYWVGWFAQNIVGYPITALWGLLPW